MFIVEQNGEMRSEPWPREKQAKRAAARIYRLEQCDTDVLSLVLYWRSRKDGSQQLCADDGRDAWATSFTVRQEAP